MAGAKERRVGGEKCAREREKPPFFSPQSPACKESRVRQPGLVDFATGLVFFVLNLPDGQVLFFGEIQITEGLLSILPVKKGFGAS